LGFTTKNPPRQTSVLTSRKTAASTPPIDCACSDRYRKRRNPAASTSRTGSISQPLAADRCLSRIISYLL